MRYAKPFPFVVLTLLVAAGLQTARAQYPTIPPSIQAEADAKRKQADQQSDDAWEKAQPVVKEWAAKGKPYLPGARQPADLPQAKIPSFPGAYGGGMYTFGGRGGKVFVVSNLNDSGPGSFREALEAGGPRLVVFNVAGIIQLKSRIRIRAPYITIAGSTAPGDGVCIAGDTVELETHDVVVRHMRFRRGQTWMGDRNDSIGGNPTGNIMIDHVSASWGLDECMSMYRHMYTPPGGDKALKLPTVNISIQNSIFSEALNTYHHSFGSTIGGLNGTYHHNLWACNAGRNPSVSTWDDFTFANNVVFNWKHRTTDGVGARNHLNIINNYYKPGPVTPKDEPIGWRIVKLETGRNTNAPAASGRTYVNGNIVAGNAKVTADNWAGGVQLESTRAVEETLKSARASAPSAHAPLNIQPAKDAYEYVLANAGATLPKRDPVDERVLKTVATGKTVAKPTKDAGDLPRSARYSEQMIASLIEEIDKGIITDISQVGGYPEYKGTPYVDTDGDGMPDDWEKKNGLNPKDASDASGDLNGDGYTNIEEFINGTNPKGKKVDWTDLKNNVDPRNKG